MQGYGPGTSLTKQTGRIPDTVILFFRRFRLQSLPRQVSSAVRNLAADFAGSASLEDHISHARRFDRRLHIVRP
jgi:hypothetical protein